MGATQNLCPELLNVLAGVSIFGVCPPDDFIHLWVRPLSPPQHTTQLPGLRPRGEKCFVQPVTATVYSMTGKKPPEYNPAARDADLLTVYFLSAAALSFSYSALAASANFWAFSATMALVFATFSIAASFAAWI